MNDLEQVILNENDRVYSLDAWVREDENSIYYLVCGEAHTWFSINSTTLDIWNLCKEKSKVQDIINGFQSIYPSICYELIKNDVLKILSIFVKKGVLMISN